MGYYIPITVAAMPPQKKQQKNGPCRNCNQYTIIITTIPYGLQQQIILACEVPTMNVAFYTHLTTT